MKSIKRNRAAGNMSSESTSKLKSENLSNKLSGDQKIELAKVGMQAINSGLSLLSEIERTKQVAIDAQVQMNESDNRLVKEILEFQKDITKIENEYRLEFKRLDDDFKLTSRKMDMIEKMIDKIDSIEIEIKVYQDKEGLNSPSVMILFDHLHKQKLSFINGLLTLGAQ